MKHIMLDCYKAEERKLDDIKLINEIMNKLVYKFKLKPIEPPHLLPYYYGSVKEDMGVTGKMLLSGGHITIHTFPLRECYFVDIFYDGKFNEKEVYEFFSIELPFDNNYSHIQVRNRDINTFATVIYDNDCDFGPHIMLDIEVVTIPNMESFFYFLENLVSKINMDPISRATVLKSSLYLSAIIIIAQSHISLHYNYETNKIYADIFSCAPFDYSKIEEEFNTLGHIVSNELVVRGTKHNYKVKNIKDIEMIEYCTYWQKNLMVK